MRLGKNFSIALLAGFFMVSSLPALSVSMANDCGAKAAMGMPCGDIDNTQIVTEKNDKDDLVRCQP